MPAGLLGRKSRPLAGTGSALPPCRRFGEPHGRLGDPFADGENVCRLYPFRLHAETQ